MGGQLQPSSPHLGVPLDQTAVIYQVLVSGSSSKIGMKSVFNKNWHQPWEVPARQTHSPKNILKFFFEEL